jgi:hypothetical protein
MIATCGVCSAKNRIPALNTARIRCGSCKRELTIRDLTGAVNEAPPVRTFDAGEDDDMLDDGDDGGDGDDGDFGF